MKNLILTIVLLSITISNTALAQDEYKKDYSLAKTGNKIYGVHVFVAAEPYYEYDYIKTIKVSITWGGTPRESFEKVIKKAKRKYKFNGLIFHNDNLSKADLIVFKGTKIKIEGFAIGDKVNFIIGSKQIEGKIIKITDKKATVGYVSSKGRNQITTVKYRNLSKLQ